MIKQQIALVEDDDDTAEFINLFLSKAGFTVKPFHDGKGFLNHIQKKKLIPDLLVLDLMLPDMDGLDICKYIRNDNSYNSLSIVILTARTEEVDRLLGLELGADDYMTKPFSPKELVARVRAILRRKDTFAEIKMVATGNDHFRIDFNKHQVTVEGDEIELTPTEFKLLKVLALQKGGVLTRDKILDYVWGKDADVYYRTVDVHIRHLRQKLMSASSYIKNVRGVGYMLDE